MIATNHETIFDDSLIQLYVAHVMTTDQLITPHWHEHLEILALISGNMSAQINEASYEFSAGDILIINPKDIHSTNTHGDCHYILLQIPPVHLERISRDWESVRFTELLSSSPDKNSISQRTYSLLMEMDDFDKQKEDGSHLLYLSGIYRLLYLLYSECSHTLSAQTLDKNRRDFHRIEQSMDYVRHHFREEISLSDIADVLSVTPEYFCRLFKKYTGQTFLTYLNQIRMQHFYRDLTETHESITSLLEHNGIRNYKVFLRDFKKLYGMTPGQVRKMQDEN